MFERVAVCLECRDELLWKAGQIDDCRDLDTSPHWTRDTESPKLTKKRMPKTEIMGSEE